MPLSPLRLAPEYDAALGRLTAALAQDGLEVELCIVGGAIFPIPFVADRGLRKPSDFFASLSHFGRIAQQAGRDGPGLGWIRNLVPRGPSPRETWIVRDRVQVFQAPPEYVFAMRCLALKSETPAGAKEVLGDLRFLLRALGVRTVEEAMELLEPYATETQLPADIQSLVTRLVSSDA